MAHFVKYPTHDLCSDLGLKVVEFKPVLGSKLGVKPTLKKKGGGVPK